MINTRLSHLDQLMASNKLDAIVLNPGPTLTYLTGLHFHLMERPTVLLYQRGEQPVIVLPELESGKLAYARIPLAAHTFGDDPSSWQAVFDQAFRRVNQQHLVVGLEPIRLRYLELDFLQKAAPACKFIAAENAISALRIQKDADEITCMRKAVQIAQTALKNTLPMLKPGVSEQEIASELIIQLYRAGSSTELPFAPIVAGGPNSANPHAVPGSRKLKRGDLVVIDWGASYNDLYSDLTRTFAIGEISPELMEIYNTVKAANATGRAAGRPGARAGDIDIAARAEIDKAGFGLFFTHRTGHGLGMEAHEQPYIFGGNELLLNEGMVYTVEPGIYLPDKGGVRIEDDLVVTADGSESLSDFSRELQIL